MRCAMARTREKRIPKYHLFWNGTKWICDWLTEWPRWMGQWRLTITTSSRKQHTFIANTKQFHLISMLNSVIFPVWLWLGSARLGSAAALFFFLLLLCSHRLNKASVRVEWLGVWLRGLFSVSSLWMDYRCCFLDEARMEEQGPFTFFLSRFGPYFLATYCMMVFAETVICMARHRPAIRLSSVRRSSKWYFECERERVMWSWSSKRH